MKKLFKTQYFELLFFFEIFTKKKNYKYAYYYITIL